MKQLWGSYPLFDNIALSFFQPLPGTWSVRDMGQDREPPSTEKHSEEMVPLASLFSQFFIMRCLAFTSDLMGRRLTPAVLTKHFLKVSFQLLKKEEVEYA